MPFLPPNQQCQSTEGQCASPTMGDSGGGLWLVRMEWCPAGWSVSASVNLPLHHKVQKFSSGTGSAGWSRKRAVKRLRCSSSSSQSHRSIPSLSVKNLYHPILAESLCVTWGALCTCVCAPLYFLQAVACMRVHSTVR